MSDPTTLLQAEDGTNILAEDNSTIWLNPSNWADAPSFTQAESLSKLVNVGGKKTLSQSESFLTIGSTPVQKSFTQSESLTVTKLPLINRTFTQTSSFVKAVAISPVTLFAQTTALSFIRAITRTILFTQAAAFTTRAAQATTKTFSQSETFSKIGSISRTVLLTQSESFSKLANVGRTVLFTQASTFLLYRKTFTVARVFSYAEALVLRAQSTVTRTWSQATTFSPYGNIHRLITMTLGENLLISKNFLHRFTQSETFAVVAHSFNIYRTFLQGTSIYSIVAIVVREIRITQSSVFSMKDFAASKLFVQVVQFFATSVPTSRVTFVQTELLRVLNNVNKNVVFMQPSTFLSRVSQSVTESITQVTAFSKVANVGSRRTMLQPSIWSVTRNLNPIVVFSQNQSLVLTSSLLVIKAIAQAMTFIPRSVPGIQRAFNQSESLAAFAGVGRTVRLTQAELLSYRAALAKNAMFNQSETFSYRAASGVLVLWLQASAFSKRANLGRTVLMAQGSSLARQAAVGCRRTIDGIGEVLTLSLARVAASVGLVQGSTFTPSGAATGTVIINSPSVFMVKPTPLAVVRFALGSALSLQPVSIRTFLRFLQATIFRQRNAKDIQNSPWTLVAPNREWQLASAYEWNLQAPDRNWTLKC